MSDRLINASTEAGRIGQSLVVLIVAVAAVCCVIGAGVYVSRRRTQREEQARLRFAGTLPFHLLGADDQARTGARAPDLYETEDEWKSAEYRMPSPEGES